MEPDSDHDSDDCHEDEVFALIIEHELEKRRLRMKVLIVLLVIFVMVGLWLFGTVLQYAYSVD